MKDITDDDIDVMARTLYGEAEANNIQDARAIACVIMNRYKLPNWPNDISDVCMQPWQFSCWNSNDPGRSRIMKADKSMEWFRQCLDIAWMATRGLVDDVTQRSTHYYATYVPKPKWARKGNKQPVYMVKHKGKHAHLFYNNIDTPPPKSPKDALDQTRGVNSTDTLKAAKVAGAGAAAIGGVGEVIQHVAPAFSMIETVSQYAPWLIVVFLLSVIGWLVWQRLEDRRAGVR